MSIAVCIHTQDQRPADIKSSFLFLGLSTQKMETIIIQETDRDILEVLYAALELEGFRVYALADYDADFFKGY